MDVGLYKLSGDQANYDTANELLVFNSTIRSCTGVSLSAGAFTFSAGLYLVFKCINLTRTSGSAGASCVTMMLADPSGTPEVYGFDNSMFSMTMDDGNNYVGTVGPAPCIIDTNVSLTLAPGLAQTPGGTGVFTVNASFTYLAVINMTAALASVGLYSLSGSQAAIDTVGEQITLNQTDRACSGVSLSGGILTFTSNGLYLVIGGPVFGRTSGTGKNLEYQWTTDSGGAGTTAFTDGRSCRCPAVDDTTPTGQNIGAVALVNRSGSDISIGMNVSVVSGSTGFTAFANTATGGGVVVMRIT